MARRLCLLGEGGLDHAVDLFEALRTLLLVAKEIGLFEGLLCKGLNAIDERHVLSGRLPVPLGLAGLFHQTVDGIDCMAHLLVSKHHRAEHHIFGELVGLRFHHQDG